LSRPSAWRVLTDGNPQTSHADPYNGGMNIVSRVPARVVAGCMLLGWVGATVAGPFDDPFGTSGRIGPHAAGMVDPLGRDCPLPKGPLTLSSTVDLALCRNPVTRASWAAARQQAAALGSSESAWVPSLTASASDNWTDANAHTPSSTLAPRTIDAALNVSWTLYDFGGREARIASARALLDAAAGTAGAVAQSTVLQAVSGFYGVIAADATLEAARSSESAAAKSLEVARGRRDAGVATRADVLQAETAWGQAQLVRVQAEGAVAAARGSLAVTLGVAADTRLELDAMPVPADVPALTSRVDDLMREAVRQRPDLAAAYAQRDAAQADVRSARATGRPSITVGATRNHIEIAGFPNQNYGSLALGFTWPVFTGFGTTYGVHQAEAALAAREATAEQVRLQVSLDVWNAYSALGTASQQLRTSAALLASALENEQVALGRYQAGVGTINDVLTAQAALASSRQQRINAEEAWQVARAEVALSVGRLTSAEPLTDLGRSP